MKTSRPLIFLARGLFVLALTLAFDTSETQAQITYQAPVATSTQPGVLRRFAARAGIGTTPFLGNMKGLGAFSTNYDIPREVRSSYNAYNRPFFRRRR